MAVSSAIALVLAFGIADPDAALPALARMSAMRMRLSTAFSFAFALGISLALPLETSARGGGLAGGGGVRAGAAIPHTFVSPINPRIARLFRGHFAWASNRHFARFARSHNGWAFPYGGYGDDGAAFTGYPPPYRVGCESQTLQVPSEDSGGSRVANIVRCSASAFSW